MIKCLLDLKVYVENLAKNDCPLTKYEWGQITELDTLFHYPFSATKKFQSKYLTPGPFMLTWKELLYHLNKNGGKLAEEISSLTK